MSQLYTHKFLRANCIHLVEETVEGNHIDDAVLTRFIPITNQEKYDRSVYLGQILETIPKNWLDIMNVIAPEQFGIESGRAILDFLFHFNRIKVDPPTALMADAIEFIPPPGLLNQADACIYFTHLTNYLIWLTYAHSVEIKVAVYELIPLISQLSADAHRIFDKTIRPRCFPGQKKIRIPRFSGFLDRCQPRVKPAFDAFKVYMRYALCNKPCMVTMSPQAMKFLKAVHSYYALHRYDPNSPMTIAAEQLARRYCKYINEREIDGAGLTVQQLGDPFIQCQTNLQVEEKGRYADGVITQLWWSLLMVAQDSTAYHIIPEESTLYYSKIKFKDLFKAGARVPNTARLCEDPVLDSKRDYAAVNLREYDKEIKSSITMGTTYKAGKGIMPYSQPTDLGMVYANYEIMNQRQLVEGDDVRMICPLHRADGWMFARVPQFHTDNGLMVNSSTEILFMHFMREVNYFEKFGLSIPREIIAALDPRCNPTSTLQLKNNQVSIERFKYIDDHYNEYIRVRRPMCIDVVLGKEKFDFLFRRGKYDIPANILPKDAAYNERRVGVEIAKKREEFAEAIRTMDADGDRKCLCKIMLAQ